MANLLRFQVFAKHFTGIWVRSCLVSRWLKVLSVLGVLGTQPLACAQQRQKTEHAAQPAQVEEIYIARSVRESRVASTEYCAEAKTGFKSTIEDRYERENNRQRPRMFWTECCVQRDWRMPSSKTDYSERGMTVVRSFLKPLG